MNILSNEKDSERQFYAVDVRRSRLCAAAAFLAPRTTISVQVPSGCFVGMSYEAGLRFIQGHALAGNVTSL